MIPFSAQNISTKFKRRLLLPSWFMSYHYDDGSHTADNMLKRFSSPTLIANINNSSALEPFNGHIM